MIHIVKRFGRVGGMESYVWHLVHGLAEHGIQVAVVCEQVCESPDDRIRIVGVEASPERPRWKSMQVFRMRVDEKIRDKFSGQSALIHSHERSLSHQVTTFHGPPIEPSRGLGWLSRFNRRITAWQQMERDELLGPNVQMILPVSSLVKLQLMNRHPEIMDKPMDIAWPGVHSSDVNPSALEPPMGLGHTRFLFVGKEWKRKGLDIAVRIVSEFRKTHPEATLTVFGVEQAALPRSMRYLDWVSFQGWVSSIPWSEFDLVLHPARKEPFGMIVTEARSHGLAVLMSSQVGAGDLNFSNTKIVDLSATPVEWCRAAKELFATNTQEPELKWSWSDLVLRHIDNIYPQLKAVKL
ncbi:MAG: glycosyltransferase family 4 protein [Pseudomonadota bacterium]|nr:glycosyltransferase family 4 protein [Pseudomonadota bacterium]